MVLLTSLGLALFVVGYKSEDCGFKLCSDNCVYIILWYFDVDLLFTLYVLNFQIYSPPCATIIKDNLFFEVL